MQEKCSREGDEIVEDISTAMLVILIIQVRVFPLCASLYFAVSPGLSSNTTGLSS